MSLIVSVVHDAPKPGEARRRHVRRLSMAKLHGTNCGAKPRDSAALRAITC